MAIFEKLKTKTESKEEKMTNFEKYREEILKITKKGDHFAVLKKA